MAIVQASLAEDILSRQERAVIRGIYRASQLHEALVTLDKVTQALQPNGSPYGENPVGNADNAKLLREYLVDGIKMALINTKVPSASSSGKGTSSMPAAKL
jgi:hypothetical protein